MLDRLFFVLFNLHPKPLAHACTVDVHGDNYVIHSQHPVIITEKDSGYIQIKSVGRMYIFCGKMLHVSVRKNTSLVTIGWIKGKSQIFEVRKNVKDTTKKAHASHANSSYVPPYYDNSSHGDNHHTSSNFCSTESASSDCSSSDSGGGDGGGD